LANQVFIIGSHGSPRHAEGAEEEAQFTNPHHKIPFFHRLVVLFSLL